VSSWRGRRALKTFTPGSLALSKAVLYDQPVQSDLSTAPKYRQIYDALKQAITSGTYQRGQRLPSEAELVKTFGASRLTVNRALRELQLGGIIDRRVGSGSYVSGPASQGYTFGLLIPELGQTEIFEPICRGMAELDLDEPHVLLWGKSPANSQDVERLAHESCRQWIAKKVSGVFFAPLEYTGQKDVINARIAELFEEAGIPLVLIDRDIVPYPERSRHDVVGIDNRRAAFVLTRHLLTSGCTRLVFVGRLESAPSCIARSAGFRDAVVESGLDFRADCIRHVDPADASDIRRIIKDMRPDGIVCSNDFTAAHVMRVLEDLSLSVPDDVRVAGFDDVKYASLLPVPLTTIHQPCAQLGASAVRLMIERLKNPDMPARDVILNFTLIVRASTGAAKAAAPSADAVTH
jgi:GntR family transcriptional regulator, arabinose operon transcriptional repressor